MILVIDNYDSFTWNLVHYLQELGTTVEVVRNDAIGVGQAIQAAAQTDDLATFPQGVQSVGMHALCNQITGSQRTAPITKSLKCSVEITRFHGG